MARIHRDIMDECYKALLHRVQGEQKNVQMWNEKTSMRVYFLCHFLPWLSRRNLKDGEQMQPLLDVQGREGVVNPGHRYVDSPLLSLLLPLVGHFLSHKIGRLEIGVRLHSSLAGQTNNKRSARHEHKTETGIAAGRPPRRVEESGRTNGGESPCIKEIY